MIDIDKVKETWVEGQAESTFEDLDNAFGHLLMYFKSQIEDMISDMFSESEFVNKMYAESE